MCKSGYWMTDWSDDAGGYGNCTSTKNPPNITNVEYWHTFYGGGMSPYTCVSDYVLSEDGKSCVSWTGDANCRQITNSSGTIRCAECKNTYIFEGTKCALHSGLLMGIAAVIAFLFFKF